MRAVILVTALLLGVIFPQIGVLESAIKYLLAGMLFFAFVDLRISKDSLHYQHFIILSVNTVVAFIIFFALKEVNYRLATALFLITFAPTAISAPGVAGWLKVNTTFVAFSTMLTNIFVVFLIPVVIPYVLQTRAEVTIISMLPALIIIFIVPFSLARIIYSKLPSFKIKVLKIKELSFVFFACNIFIASGKAVTFIQNSKEIPNSEILLVTLLSGVVAIVSFYAGTFIIGKKYKIEGMLAMGQKNTMFSVWIALTYISPYAALAPISYILWQNIIVSWILRKYKNI